MAQTVAAAGQSTTPVGVHLDHCRHLEQIRVALDLGYSSVMVDGSHLPFEENIALTAEVVALARGYDAWVEGELEAVPGDEHRSTNAASGTMTDPEQARTFAQETGVDALAVAVAVGNVHGFTASPITLDVERLQQIAARWPPPLVLHGASGVEAGPLTRAVAAGVVKVNVNTELRRAFLSSLAPAQAEESGWSVVPWHSWWRRRSGSSGRDRGLDTGRRTRRNRVGSFCPRTSAQWAPRGRRPARRRDHCSRGRLAHHRGVQGPQHRSAGTSRDCTVLLVRRPVHRPRGDGRSMSTGVSTLAGLCQRAPRRPRPRRLHCAATERGRTVCGRWKTDRGTAPPSTTSCRGTSPWWLEAVLCWALAQKSSAHPSR